MLFIKSASDKQNRQPEIPLAINAVNKEHRDKEQSDRDTSLTCCFVISGYTAVIPSFLIKVAQYWVSLSIKSAVEAGVEFANGSKPSSMNRPKFAGVAITRLMALFRV